MAIFKPYKITSSQLEGLAKSEGQFIVTTDTNKIYLDETDSSRIELIPVPTKTSDLVNDMNFMSGMTILSYGHSTWSDFITAYTAKHVVYTRASSGSNPASGSQTRLAFMAYVNNAENPTEVEFQYYRSVSSHSDSQQGDQTYVYKLNKTNGWSVTVRENYTKVVAGTGMSSTWSGGKITLNCTVTPPTKTSDLTNDSGFIDNTVDDLTNYTKTSDLATVATTGDYTDLINTPTNIGTITGVSVNGTSVATSGVADITSVPASILTGAIPSAVTATTQSQGDNSTKIATTAYVDTAIDNLPDPMVFKGSLGTGGTITALPIDGSANIGDTYKVITAGTYASKAADVGDTFICLTKTSSANTWELIPSGDEPSGTVTSVAINATSPIVVDDSAAITTSGTRTLSHATSGVTAGTYKSVTVDDKGHVTAGTNPTTVSGYGITDSITRVSTLPTASAAYGGQVFCYTGPTGGLYAPYINGHFYQCLDLDDEGHYAWVDLADEEYDYIIDARDIINTEWSPFGSWTYITDLTIKSQLYNLAKEIVSSTDQTVKPLKIALRVGEGPQTTDYYDNIFLTATSISYGSNDGVGYDEGTITITFSNNYYKVWIHFGDVSASSTSNLYVQYKIMHMETQVFDYMPTPSNIYEGEVIQYLGNTSGNYIHGYFYECLYDGDEHYYWQQIDVQEGSAFDYIITFTDITPSVDKSWTVIEDNTLLTQLNNIINDNIWENGKIKPLRILIQFADSTHNVFHNFIIQNAYGQKWEDEGIECESDYFTSYVKRYFDINENEYQYQFALNYSKGYDSGVISSEWQLLYYQIASVSSEDPANKLSNYSYMYDSAHHGYNSQTYYPSTQFLYDYSNDKHKHESRVIKYYGDYDSRTTRFIFSTTLTDGRIGSWHIYYDAAALARGKFLYTYHNASLGAVNSEWNYLVTYIHLDYKIYYRSTNQYFGYCHFIYPDGHMGLAYIKQGYVGLYQAPVFEIASDESIISDYRPITKKYVDDTISSYELLTNKVTSMSSSSTNAQYPSAKCVYDSIEDSKFDYVIDATSNEISLSNPGSLTLIASQDLLDQLNQITTDGVLKQDGNVKDLRIALHIENSTNETNYYYLLYNIECNHGTDSYSGDWMHCYFNFQGHNNSYLYLYYFKGRDDETDLPLEQWKYYYDTQYNKFGYKTSQISSSNESSDIPFPSTKAVANYVKNKAVLYFSTMPTASSTYNNKIVQFTGATSASYTNGYFYKCVNNSGTYSWQQVDVQSPRYDYELYSSITFNNLSKLGYWYTLSSDTALVSQLNQMIETGLFDDSYIKKMTAVLTTCDDGCGYYKEMYTLQSIYADTSNSPEYYYFVFSNFSNLQLTFRCSRDTTNTWAYQVTGSIERCYTMPTPTFIDENRIVMYTGTTNSNYTNGYIYKCIRESYNNYVWQRIDVQPASTDTKNTAGTTNTTSKIYLAGATSQADNPQTYSNVNCYASGGKLYSNAKEVVTLSDSQALTNKTYNGYTLAAASAKAVDSSISAGSTSTNLPTSQAVAAYVDSKQNQILSGTTDPSNSLGVNGDVYIKY